MAIDRVCYWDRTNSKWISSATDASQVYSDAATPYIRQREKIDLDFNCYTVDNDGTQTAYTGWDGSFTFRFFIDNDWTQVIDSTLVVGLSGAITKVTLATADFSTAPQTTGRFILTNGSAESETVDYTSYATVGDNYEFVVSATLTYVYAIGDQCDLVEPNLVEASNSDIDSTNKATGRLIVTLDADNTAYIAAAQTSSNGEITNSKWELQVLDATNDLVDSISGDFKTYALLADDFALPPPGPASLYQKIFGQYVTPNPEALAATDRVFVYNASDGGTYEATMAQVSAYTVSGLTEDTVPVMGATDLEDSAITDNGSEVTITGEDLVLDGTQSIGIGTSPAQRLHVSGSGTQRFLMTDSSGPTSINMKAGAGYGFFGTTSNSPMLIQINDTNKILIDTSGNLGIGEVTTLNSKLSVKGSASVGDSYSQTAAPSNGMIIEGNVGIGTDNPSEELEISKAGTPRWLVTDTTTPTGLEGGCTDTYGFLGTSTNHELQFRINSATQMVLDSSGNVGINTTGPDAKLDVLDTSGAQLRLTYTDGSVYSDFTVDSGGDLTIAPSGGDVTIGGSLDCEDATQTQFWAHGWDAAGASAQSGQIQVGGSSLGDNESFIIRYSRSARDVNMSSTNADTIKLSASGSSVLSLTPTTATFSGGIALSGGITGVTSQVQISDAAKSQLDISGWDSIGGAATGSGSLLIGDDYTIEYSRGSRTVRHTNAGVSGEYYFSLSTGLVFALDTSGNALIGGLTAAGTSATKTLGIGTGTSPSSSPADMIQLYSADWNGAGTATPHFRNEAGTVIKLNQSLLTTDAVEFAQSSASGAAHVLGLTQADVDEPFMKLIGTAAAATVTNSIVAVGDVTTATVAGYVKMEVQDDGNQITDQDYYMPIYTLT